MLQHTDFDFIERDKRENVTSRLAKNTFFLVVSRALGIFITFGIVAVVARYLGIKLFGFYALTTAIAMAIRPLMELGLDAILCREISKERDNADLYVSSVITMRIFLCCFIFVVSFIILKYYSSWDNTINLSILLAIICEMLLCIGMTCLSVIRAFEKMEYELYCTTIRNVTSFIFILVVVFYNWGYLGIFYAKLFSSMVFLLFSALFLYGKFTKLLIRFSVSFSKFILKESYPIAIFALLLSLIFKVDIFFLKLFGNIVDISLYEVPHRLIVHTQVLPMAFVSSIFPLFSRTASRDSRNILSNYYGNSSKLLWILGIPISALLLYGGEPLIITVFGEEFIKSIIAMNILAPTVMFLFLNSLQNFLLTSIGKQTLNLIGITISLIVNIILDTLLIPQYGYIGASIATLFSYLTLVLINSYFIAKHGIRTSNRTFVLKIVLSGVIMCTAAFIHAKNPMVGLMLRLCAGFTLYTISMLLLKTVSYEDIFMIKEIFLKKRYRKEFQPTI
ncbi:MAG: flippase [Thermodesulfobacteriota bacterium]|nr:flippase [Thermodesulfobacteriota bacterium]